MADQETTERILDIKVNYEDALKGISQYLQKIQELKNTEKELKDQLKAGNITQEEYNKSITASKIQTQEYNDTIRTLQKEIRNNIKAENEQSGSLKQLRAQLSSLNSEYDSLSKAERESSTGVKLKEQINSITEELKGAEEETGRFYRNVGNYTESITKATEANLPFISQIQTLIETTSTFSKYLNDIKGELSLISEKYKSNAEAASQLSGAAKAAAVSSNVLSTSLKVLTLALASTGIGVLVIALGTLISYFTRTQKGTEQLSKAFSAVSAIVDVFLDRLAKLGSAIVKVFSGDFKGAAEDAKAAVSGINDELREEISLSVKLKEVQNQLDKQEVMLSMRRAASKADIEALKKLSDDTTKSIEERMQAAQKAYELEQKDLKEQTELAEKRLAASLGYAEMNEEVRKVIQEIKVGAIEANEVISKLGLSESTIEDLRQFREQFNQLQELQESSYTRQTEQQNKLNTIRKEASDAEINRKTKEIEAIRQAEDAMLATLKDGIEKQRKEINLSYDRQIEDLKKRLSEEKDLTQKAREAINQTVVALEKQRQNDLNTLSNEEIQKQISNEQRRIELMLATVKEGSEKEFELRKQQLELQMNAELSNTEITEQEKQLIRDKYAKQESELVVQRQQEIANKQAEAVRLEFENRIAEAKLQGEDELQIKLELRKQELDSLHQLEGESNEEFRARQLEAMQNLADAEEEIANREIDIQQKKANALATIAGNLSDLIEQAAGDNEAMAELAKVLAIAEVSIAQGVAIAQAVKNVTKSSFSWIEMLTAIGTVVGAVTAVMSTAMKSIKSAKFATGGIFNGDGYVSGPGSGTSDSINARLSNGESVITARATSMFAPLLSAMNVAGGGVPISVTVDNNQQIGEDMLARAFAKGASSLPNPVVSVSEIDTVNNRVETLENLGTA
ncbi:hypothetical protein [Coprobacter secundus]|uniref:Uncharacterized protein n=1 Tax=Coprobacter secundus subsp. similis TaxID=2751153 RepID=A0A7G1I0W9_9BACT|nr:hypothetical protein [Coprobacter secundus]BCI64883.1 hypothetical protein Cop2CBH44_32360 [Coprobacter secundus subsp. similis]